MSENSGPNPGGTPNNISLIVRQGSLETMERALSTAHDQIVEALTSMRREVSALTINWASDSPSRQAQLAFDTELNTKVVAMTDALTKIRTDLATVRQAAHTAEVRNVAIMD